MRADDDGFINNPKRIQRMIGASDDDLKLLIAKSFVILFESGVVVIKHWKIHNYIQNDRYKPTVYAEEKSLLDVKKNKAYTLNTNECIQNVYNVDTQDRLGKDSIGKDRIGKDSIEIEEPKSKAKRFTPPTLEEVTAYCIERGNNVDAQHFIDYYTSNGWLVGKNKMKDWKAAVRTWERNGYSSTKTNRPNTKAQELNDFYNVASEWAESEGE